MEICLALGSNLGDRVANMATAAQEILKISGVRILAQSHIYETDPVGLSPEQSDMLFLNGVVLVECKNDIRTFAAELRRIEIELGRESDRQPKASTDYAEARTIDIDIIYIDDLVLEEASLTVPHPRWAEREFVLRPLADLRPDLRLPGRNRTVSEILVALPAGAKVVPFEGRTTSTIEKE